MTDIERVGKCRHAKLMFTKGRRQSRKQTGGRVLNRVNEIKVKNDV